MINDPRVEVALPSASTPEGARALEYAKSAARLTPSPTDSELYKALAKSAAGVWSAPVTPYLFQAGTDAAAWRSKGIPVYGIYPYPISAEDLTRMHGNDERVPVDSLEQGTEVIYKTLLEVAAK